MKKFYFPTEGPFGNLMNFELLSIASYLFSSRPPRSAKKENRCGAMEFLIISAKYPPFLVADKRIEPPILQTSLFRHLDYGGKMADIVARGKSWQSTSL